MRISDWSSDVCSSDLGIASFGPLDLDPSSPRYGRIVHTPKPGWNQAFLADLAGGKPFALDTDANGAAIAEGLWGGAPGLSSWAYVTHGTGNGVGSIVAGHDRKSVGQGKSV